MSTSQTPYIEFQNISKWFGENCANANVNLNIHKGSIHGIVGENGAGKSTIMKILFGLYQADEGQIKINNQVLNLRTPTDAINAGIGMVHQHFMLAEPFSALDNIILHSKKLNFFLDRKSYRQKLQDICQQYSFDIDLDVPISQLSVGQQQRVEILKILSQNSDIIILDEPTAVLTPDEIDSLFSNLKKLRDNGKTILIISHKLNEIVRITDRVSIFRQGRVIDTKATQETNAQELAELMIGKRLSVAPARTTSVQTTDAILQIKGLRCEYNQNKLHNIDIKIHANEIVGIAGVEGNGQEALIQAILAPQTVRDLQGQVLLSQQEIQKLSALQIRQKKVAAFAEDRLHLGVLPERPLYENFLLGQQHHPDYKKGPWIDFKNLHHLTQKAIHQYDIRPPQQDLKISQLSGGNQQKLVVARELQNNPHFLIAAQPTRGVDIGAIDFIHSQIRATRDRGAAVLLISSELDEILTLSDRVFVIFKGALVAEFTQSPFNVKKIGAAMTGKLES